ncbi:cell wall protein RTB1 isoform X1 [Esox lucius]|uniref:cell wall protein RTB1 isoform X1 n=1 Tax=Esox lucius TaxID=8010 RepID=UPI001476E0B2|nr:cell wall protein RTB1 isoform X1 [Esox lucius]
MAPDRSGRELEEQCLLCKSSEENETTGPLSTKENVTAHQNCLFYSSGIFCKCTPEFDDLFGFSVEDVRKETKRGNRLTCHRCKKKGATVGCEVKHCSRSYHFPCSVLDKAYISEDSTKGEYMMYCLKHNPNSSTEMVADLEAGPSSHNNVSKTPENQHQKTLKRRLSFSNEQEVTSQKKVKGRIVDDSFCSGGDVDEADIGLPPLESDLEDSANQTPAEVSTLTSKNALEDIDDDVTIIDSDSESESLLLPVTLCLGSIKSYQESGRHGGSLTASHNPISPADTGTPECTVSRSASPVPPVSRSVSPVSRSASPVPPVSRSASPVPPVSRSVSPVSRSASPAPPFSRSVSPVPKVTPESPFSPVSPESLVPAVLTKSPVARKSMVPPECPLVAALPSSSVPCFPGPDSPSGSASDSSTAVSRMFWRRCNEAQCTESLFDALILDLVGMSKRIISDRASQEDCDLALNVMKASGKLPQMLSQQEDEFKKAQSELQRAAAAIREARSTLEK